MVISAKDLRDRNYKRTAWGIVGAGFFVTLLYGWMTSPSDHKWSAAMAGLLTAAAPFTLGGLLGFLFGIPKTLQQQEPEGKNGTAVLRHGWQTNTNLEQVSDWLTKILIGVGLTQLTEIPARVQDTGGYIAAALGPGASPAVVTSILVVFAISGFVIAYLLTKFDLGRAIDVQDGLLDDLANAIVKNPNDRNAVESYMLSSLYLDPPEGFERAIQTGQAFLSQEGHPRPEDGNVFAYLACAYGEKHHFETKRKAPQSELDLIRDAVVANAREAIAREPAWKARLRQLANPPVGSKDDDLVTLKDDAQLRQLLAIT